jgi:hypothetical protein
MQKNALNLIEGEGKDKERQTILNSILIEVVSLMVSCEDSVFYHQRYFNNIPNVFLKLKELVLIFADEYKAFSLT